MEDVDLIGIREADPPRHPARHRHDRRLRSGAHASVARGMEADPREAGLSYRECSTVMERIAASEELRAIVLSGLGDDPEPAALDAAYGYLLSALGKRILA